MRAWPTKIWGTRAVDNRRHRAAAKASIAECVAPPVKLKRIVALIDGMFSGGFGLRSQWADWRTGQMSSEIPR